MESAFVLVGAGQQHPGAHQLEVQADRGGPLVALLWGRDAQQAEHLLPGVPVIKSPHPSPLSAHTGFFGSRPFSRVNQALEAQGAQPIDWRIPA